jgi:5-methylcytosine-specific restriction enzyme subunit McrC
MGRKPPIQVFEYETLIIKDEALKEALDTYYGDSGVPYFDLTRSGVRFKQFVGVIQVGDYTIEVLPKIDKTSNDKATWQKVLMTMLLQSGIVKAVDTSTANLKLHRNNILDVYIDRFLSECEYLVNRGLIKRYRQTHGNKTSLKGSLMFEKHLAANLIHKERFYVKHTVYDQHHLLNQLLLKTIHLLSQVATAPHLRSRIGSLQLTFPEMRDLKVTEATFSKILYDRKSLHYKRAIEIAELLLLNFHPDIRTGRKNVIALMFDMNVLWETWVLKQLQKLVIPPMKVSGQLSEAFWLPTKGNGYSKTLRPDIIVQTGKSTIILDTKWKVPKDGKPSDDDLKQMFAYNNRFNAKRSILVYPGSQPNYSGDFFGSHGECEVYFLNVLDDSGNLVSSGVSELALSLTKQALNV